MRTRVRVAEEMGARLATGALLLGRLSQGHAARTCGSARQGMSLPRGGAGSGPAHVLASRGRNCASIRCTPAGHHVQTVVARNDREASSAKNVLRSTALYFFSVMDVVFAPN